MCDFKTGFEAPEMVKKRPVVVISPWSRRHTQLFTVVPLSRTEPKPVRDYHVLLQQNLVPGWDDDLWAKCDFVVTVGMQRLDRIMPGRDENNKRYYVSPNVSDADLRAIQLAVLHALGYSSLTAHW